MMTWEVLLMPTVGGLIGWMTNVVAIKMLFWPRRPIRLLGARVKLLGLLPKRRRDLARSVAQAVDEELLPMEEILERIEHSGYQEHLVSSIVYHVDVRLNRVLPRIIPVGIRTVLRDYIKETVNSESRRMIDQVAASTMDKLRHEAHLGQLVEEKIMSFDLDQLEVLIKGIAAAELKHIELLGAILGLLIGSFQAILLFWRFTP